MTGVEGKLRERIGCCGRSWSTSETWELRTENRSFVCVSKCVFPFENRQAKGENFTGEDK